MPTPLWFPPEGSDCWLLVDGQGQAHGTEYGGRIVDCHVQGDSARVTGDATAAYAGRLQQYLRTVVLVSADVIVLHDRVTAAQPVMLEWLFHHRGEARGDEKQTTISRGGVTLSMRRLLPESAECWRVSDVKRTSAYTNSNTLQPERVTMQYRSMGPFHPCQHMEVVWILCIEGGDIDGSGTLPYSRCRTSDTTITVEIDSPSGGYHTVELARR